LEQFYTNPYGNFVVPGCFDIMLDWFQLGVLYGMSNKLKLINVLFLRII